jgi:hypothetical protein
LARDAAWAAARRAVTAKPCLAAREGARNCNGREPLQFAAPIHLFPPPGAPQDHLPHNLLLRVTLRHGALQELASGYARVVAGAAPCCALPGLRAGGRCALARRKGRRGLGSARNPTCTPGASTTTMQQHRGAAWDAAPERVSERVSASPAGPIGPPPRPSLPRAAPPPAAPPPPHSACFASSRRAGSRPPWAPARPRSRSATSRSGSRVRPVALTTAAGRSAQPGCGLRPGRFRWCPLGTAWASAAEGFSHPHGARARLPCRGAAPAAAGGGGAGTLSRVGSLSFPPRRPGGDWHGDLGAQRAGLQLVRGRGDVRLLMGRALTCGGAGVWLEKGRVFGSRGGGGAGRLGC